MPTFYLDLWAQLLLSWNGTAFTKTGFYGDDIIRNYQIYLKRVSSSWVTNSPNFVITEILDFEIWIQHLSHKNSGGVRDREEEKNLKKGCFM